MCSIPEFFSSRILLTRFCRVNYSVKFPLGILIFFLLIGCIEKNTADLTIAAAANVQFALQPLMDAFTEETGITSESSIGSSGTLTAQIMAGAPFDVFISADMKYPRQLSDAGITVKGPEVYANGVLVLWSINQSPSLEMLRQKKINHIAMANPKTAPYGEAAMAVLNNLGLYDSLQDNLVFGESISQANQFILSGAAEIGFTAKSVVLSNELQGKGNWIEISEQLYPPLAQGAVVIRHDDRSPSNAIRFYDFLFSEKAQVILSNYGYRINE